MVQIAKKYFMTPVVLIIKRQQSDSPVYSRSESHTKKSEDGFLTLWFRENKQNPSQS